MSKKQHHSNKSKGQMGKKRHYDRDGHRMRKKHWRNEHHLLFPKADWSKSFFGKKIREHRYFRRFIPEYTLHRAIHSKMTVIPLPPESACEEAYYEILRRCESCLIDGRTDTLERRLQLLIDLWRDYPETVKALEKQQKIAIEFYKK